MTLLEQMDRPSRLTMTDRVAALFKASPGLWIDGRDLAKVGGYAAYRTRISDVRKPPYNLRIENRTRRTRGLVESHYRYIAED